MAEARRAPRSSRASKSRSRRAQAQATDVAGSLRETWRRLNFEQRVAAVAALLLIVSTFGPFSFVEAAIVLTAAGVLALLKKRADRKEFHLPFGDGTVILTAGLWCGLLIVVRLFDRELGQSVLALVCAAILAGAGARERAKRPADDLPPPGPDADFEAARRPPDLPPPGSAPQLRQAEPEPPRSEPRPRRSEPQARRSEPEPRRSEPEPRRSEQPPRRSEPEPRRSEREPRAREGTARLDASEELTEQLSLRDEPTQERRRAPPREEKPPTRDENPPAREKKPPAREENAPEEPRGDLPMS
jgi:hypothetical protein